MFVDLAALNGKHRGGRRVQKLRCLYGVCGLVKHKPLQRHVPFPLHSENTGSLHNQAY
jgi:hypothetical protein